MKLNAKEIPYLKYAVAAFLSIMATSLFLRIVIITPRSKHKIMIKELERWSQNCTELSVDFLENELDQDKIDNWVDGCYSFEGSLKILGNGGFGNELGSLLKNHLRFFHQV